MCEVRNVVGVLPASVVLKLFVCLPNDRFHLRSRWRDRARLLTQGGDWRYDERCHDKKRNERSHLDPLSQHTSSPLIHYRERPHSAGGPLKSELLRKVVFEGKLDPKIVRLE